MKCVLKKGISGVSDLWSVVEPSQTRGEEEKSEKYDQ